MSLARQLPPAPVTSLNLVDHANCTAPIPATFLHHKAIFTHENVSSTDGDATSTHQEPVLLHHPEISCTQEIVIRYQPGISCHQEISSCTGKPSRWMRKSFSHIRQRLPCIGKPVSYDWNSRGGITKAGSRSSKRLPMIGKLFPDPRKPLHGIPGSPADPRFHLAR